MTIYRTDHFEEALTFEGINRLTRICVMNMRGCSVHLEGRGEIMLHSAVYCGRCGRSDIAKRREKQRDMHNRTRAYGGTEKIPIGECQNDPPLH